MKLIRVFLLITIVLLMAACYPASAAPSQIISHVGNTQMATNAPAIISVTTIPITEVVNTPALHLAPLKPTVTSEVENNISMLPSEPLTITIVYDNYQYDQKLSIAWGFSALVEYGDYVLLFDTGGDGQILMENISILGIDPTRIEAVVLSHAHDDHTGGLTALLDTGAKPLVYLLPSFPVSFKRQIEQFTQVSEVLPGQSFTEGLWTTGDVGGTIPEQALVIQTEHGLVVITGCAHPGIVAIIEQAQSLFEEPVYLVMGGFHLGNKSEAEIDAILEDFRRLEVERVAPCHCTGENAISRFATEYEMDFIQVGVGSVIRLEVIKSK